MAINPKWRVSVSLGPLAPSLVAAVLHPVVLNNLLDEKQFAALGQFAGIIVKDRVLEAPTAIFKGLNRPLHSGGIDRFVFIYCCKPTCTYPSVPTTVRHLPPGV